MAMFTELLTAACLQRPMGPLHSSGDIRSLHVILVALDTEAQR